MIRLIEVNQAFDGKPATLTRSNRLVGESTLAKLFKLFHLIKYILEVFPLQHFIIFFKIIYYYDLLSTSLLRSILTKFLPTLFHMF